jgi:hypothetical protein
MSNPFDNDTIGSSMEVKATSPRARKTHLRLFEESKSDTSATVAAETTSAPPLVFPQLTADSLQMQLAKHRVAIECDGIVSGLDAKALHTALIESDFDYPTARSLLIKSITSCYENSFSGPEFCREYSNEYLVSLWRPPISIRVSSWLQESSTSEVTDQKMHTVYEIKITLTARPAESWQIYRSYSSQLYSNLYSTLYPHLKGAFHQEMTHPFPDDYWKGRIFGVSTEMRDWRQRGLDLWFKELTMNPKIILNDVCQGILYKFLEVPM